MLRLRGQALATVDDKGRLKLPVVFKSGMEDLGLSEVSDYNRYYLTSFDGQSARFYPISVWEMIEAKLSNLSSNNQSKRRFLEVTAYYGFDASLDVKDRFLLPRTLRESAQLRDEVVVLGQIDHLAIWNRDLFECRLSVDPLTIDDLALLAEFGI